MAEKRKLFELDNFSKMTTFLSSIVSIVNVEVRFFSDEKNPPADESKNKNPLRHVSPDFVRRMRKDHSGPPPTKPNDVARFSVQSNQYSQAPRTRSSPPPAQVPRARSSQPPAQLQRDDSSQRPTKRQKTIDPEHALLMMQNKDRIRQLFLGSQNIREYAKSVLFPPEEYVCTGPTADEIVRKETEKFIEEQNRMERLQVDNPGVSMKTLLKVSPPPTIDSENLKRKYRLKTEMLKKIAERRKLPPESIPKFISDNWENVNIDTLKYVELYGLHALDETRRGGRGR